MAEFADECTSALLSKPQYNFLFPAGCSLQNWPIDEIKAANEDFLKSLRGRANVYALFVRRSSGAKWLSVADYSLSKNNLINNYPEIASYEEHWRGFSPNFPTEKNLVGRLGEPNKIERAWSEPIFTVGLLAAISADPIVWAIIFVLRPYPTKTYFFEKGSYCVEAKIDKSISTDYEPRMRSWAWNENKKTCGN